MPQATNVPNVRRIIIRVLVLLAHWYVSFSVFVLHPAALFVVYCGSCHGVQMMDSVCKERAETEICFQCCLFVCRPICIKKLPFWIQWNLMDKVKHRQGNNGKYGIDLRWALPLVSCFLDAAISSCEQALVKSTSLKTWFTPKSNLVLFFNLNHFHVGCQIFEILAVEMSAFFWIEWNKFALAL